MELRGDCQPTYGELDEEDAAEEEEEACVGHDVPEDAEHELCVALRDMPRSGDRCAFAVGCAKSRDLRRPKMW